MLSESSKNDLWENWITQTVLADIKRHETPDPVPMINDSGIELEMTDQYNTYRLGRGSGDYLYILYLLNEPVTDSIDVVPIYIGETGQIATRLMDHFRKLRDSLPISEWKGDGSWGSYGKYDHIATVYEQTESPLYAWVVNVKDIDTGPYGYPTYRQELEAKTVGLVHSHPQFNRVFANRDFVPNRVPHEMGKVGPDWVDTQHDVPNQEAEIASNHTGKDLSGKTKADLWHEWVEQTILRDIRDTNEEGAIPLFETDDDLVVELKDVGSSTVLKRSEQIDTRIRREGARCVHRNGVKDGPNGLLYVMYQLDSDNPSPKEIIPRYIGKAEAYGKKNELSANFGEIAKNRTTTRSFARWGDGSYWHVGELSDTIFGEDSKKLSWADELFKQGTHQLRDQTYLWIRAWDSESYPGPYGYPAYLAEVEALLIGLAYDAHPEQILNHSELPKEAPSNSKQYQFQPVSK